MRALRYILIILILIGLAGGGYWYWKTKIQSKSEGSVLMKDSGEGISDYSAVFSTNGQVYFGKLHSTPEGWYDLTDAYYLQVDPQTDTKTKTAAALDAQVIRLDKMVHGPNNRMRLNPAQVLFTESLKETSKVLDIIKGDQK